MKSDENKKKQVIKKIFEHCYKTQNFIFNNELVKEICKEVGFGNPFDATKMDTIEKLPEILIEEDYGLVHIGNGQHMFIKGLKNVYHEFEPIPKSKIIDWPYKKSLLNKYNTSESNILSVANNQRILHHFLFGIDKEFDKIDIHERPKTYFPHRTKTNLEYFIGKQKIKLEKIQIEIDLTIEYKGIIGIFEAKNGMPKNFSIYQIYHPFLYYHHAKNNPNVKGKIKDIFCIYVVRKQEKKFDSIKLWKYTFDKPNKMNSIKLIDAKQYNLIQTN